MKCLCGNQATHKVTYKDTNEVDYYCGICGNEIEACEDSFMVCEELYPEAAIMIISDIKKALKKDGEYIIEDMEITLDNMNNCEVVKRRKSDICMFGMVGTGRIS